MLSTLAYTDSKNVLCQFGSLISPSLGYTAELGAADLLLGILDFVAGVDQMATKEHLSRVLVAHRLYAATMSSPRSHTSRCETMRPSQKMELPDAPVCLLPHSLIEVAELGKGLNGGRRVADVGGGEPCQKRVNDSIELGHGEV